MHGCEQQHGQALRLGGGEEQRRQTTVLGDTGGEPGVQRGVDRLGEVGEQRLAVTDRRGVAG